MEEEVVYRIYCSWLQDLVVL